MTIQGRNRIILYLNHLASIWNIFLFVQIFLNYPSIRSLFIGTIEGQSWWFIYSNHSPLILRYSLWSLGILVVCGIVSNYVLHSFFRKSASQEMFYFRYFLLSLSFYSIRLLNLFVEIFHYGSQYQALVTRASLFLRVFGLGCLFLSGIAIFDKKFQRMSIIFLAVFVSSFVMCSIIPVSQEFILGALINPLVDEVTLFMFVFILQLIVLMNYALYLYHRKSQDNLWMTLGIFIILISTDLLFYFNPLMIYLSMLFIPLGIFLFSRKIYLLYQWR